MSTDKSKLLIIVLLNNIKLINNDLWVGIDIIIQYLEFSYKKNRNYIVFISGRRSIVTN